MILTYTIIVHLLSALMSGALSQPLEAQVYTVILCTCLLCLLRHVKIFCMWIGTIIVGKEYETLAI